MASSKKLVYIPSIQKDTWLLLSQRGRTVYLRDYSTGQPEIIRKTTVAEIDELLARPGAYSERVAVFNRVRVTSAEFWCEQIRSRNVELDTVEHEKEHRIQDELKRQCMPHIQAGRLQELRGVIGQWVRRFDVIQEREQFNHWDNDDASKHFSLDKGLGWQTHLLENCRQEGEISFIPTGNPDTDFFFAATELHLCISSKLNPINPGYGDRINPDGLGIRRDRFFTVFEVKGPKDEKTLLEPVLQGLCGALAVYAKRKMIQTIARTAGERRPAFPNALIPKTVPSLGIHVLTAKSDMRGRNRLPKWGREIEQHCRLVIDAFSPLKYIAYSFVEPDKRNPFAKMPVDRLIAR